MQSAAPLPSLPYVDPLPSAYEEYALRLIENEMSSMQASTSNYPLPPHLTRVKTTNGSTLLDSYYAEISQRNGVPPERSGFVGDALGGVGFPPEPTGSLKNERHAWSSALSRARSAVEKERGRLMNLELLQEFGTSSHLVANEEGMRIRDGVEKEIGARRQRIDAVNAVRKREQEEITGSIQNLERKWWELKRTLAEVKGENQRIKKMRGDDAE